MNYLYKSDKQYVYAGKVVYDPTLYPAKDGKPAATKVVIKDYAGEELTIFYRNKSATEAGIAERVMAAKVRKDVFLVCLVLRSEGDKSATGLNFMYSGLWSLNTASEKQCTIIAGPAYQVTATDNRVSLAIPVTVGKDENGDRLADWYRVTFFDGQSADGATQWHNAAHAKKVLGIKEDGTSDKHVSIAVCGGEIVAHEYEAKDGTPRTEMQIIGYNCTGLY